MAPSLPDIRAKWFYQPNTGAVFDYNPYLIPPLWWPLIKGPFDTKEAAYAYYEANKAANPDWKAPKNISPDIPTPAEAIPGVPGVGELKDFLNILTNKNLWIRLAEFGVGVLLLAIGANALMKQATGVNVGGTARKVVTKGVM